MLSLPPSSVGRDTTTNPFDDNPFSPAAVVTSTKPNDVSRSHMNDASSPSKSKTPNRAVDNNRQKTICHYVLACLFHILNCCGRYGKCTPVRLRYWAITAGIVFTLVTTFFITLDLYSLGTQPHTLAWFSGGVFVLIAIPLSLYEIFMHLVHFTCPSSQRHIVRIIWMVPIYGVESWLALRYKEYAIYMQAAREFYEAFAILSFLQYLLNNLGSTYDEISEKIRKDAKPVKHGFPFAVYDNGNWGKNFWQNANSGFCRTSFARYLPRL